MTGRVTHIDEHQFRRFYKSSSNFYANNGIKAGGRVAGTEVRAIVQPGYRFLGFVEVSTNSLTPE